MRRPFRASAPSAAPSRQQRACAGVQVSPESVIRSGPSVAAWAWTQPTFRAAADYGVVEACAQCGNLYPLERVMDHFNTDNGYKHDVFASAKKGGHVHVLQWLLSRAVRLSGTELLIYDYGIGANAMMGLASALRANTTLTKLDLGYNEIGAVGAQHIAEALKVNATVTELDMCHNEFGPEGAKHLADALAANATLTNLNVLKNDLTEAGACALVAVANSKPNQIKSLFGIAASATVDLY